MKNIDKKNFKKLLAGVSSGILVFSQTFIPMAVIAEEPVITPIVEETQAPTPTETPIITLTDTPTETPIPSPTDEAVSVEATLSPTPTPTPDLEIDLMATNSAEMIDEASMSANTGNNTVNTTDFSGQPNSQPNGQPNNQGGGSSRNVAPTSSLNPTIQTGDAISQTVVDTAVNTTEVNSQVIYHTINLYIDGGGDIDLSMPAEVAQTLVAMHPDDEFISAIANVSQKASVDNTITAGTNTGGNIADESGTINITTGDAIALLSLLNRINFVMIDSVVHIVTINIFGNFLGNILLPDLPTPTTTCTECGSINIEQQATVTTTIKSDANTGNNMITGETGDITTGNAYNGVQIINIINSLLYGSQVAHLYVFNYGSWDGEFIGWATEDGSVTEDTVLNPNSSNCPTCFSNVSIFNSANVNNSINLTANTGNNTVTATDGTIITGNAYTGASIINLVNSAFIKSFGIFAFVNIFGSWTGDIGSKSLFPTPTHEPVVQQASSSVSEEDTSKRPGGLLEVVQWNNVGEYVLPGDTVTFFIEVKNTGTGPVRDSIINLRLIKDNIDRGGAKIAIGTLEAGKKKKITTGFVLSQNTPGGLYTTRAIAGGKVGPSDSLVTAEMFGSFLVWGYGGQIDEGEPIVQSEEPVAVLGATAAPQNSNPSILYALLVFLMLLPEYALFKALKDKQLMNLILTPSAPAFARLRALHLFLV